MWFFHLALQGAARMALQPEAHPAQIEDSVASELGQRLIPKVFFARSRVLISSWWLYHRRSAYPGGWASEIHYCSCHSGCDRARWRTWSTRNEVAFKLDHGVEVLSRMRRERREIDR